MRAGLVLATAFLLSAALTSARPDDALRTVRFNDNVEPAGTLHAYLGTSDVTHARIRSLDLSAERGLLRDLVHSNIKNRI